MLHTVNNFFFKSPDISRKVGFLTDAYPHCPHSPRSTLDEPVPSVTPSYEPVPSVSSAPPASFLPAPSVSLCIPLPSHPVRTCSLNLFSSSCFRSSRSLRLSLYPTAQSPRTNLFPQSLQLLLLPFFPLPPSLSVSHCPVTLYEPVPSISSAPPASFLPAPSVSLCPTAQSPRTNLFPQSLQLLLLPFFPLPLSLSVSHCPVTPYEPVPSVSSAPPASFLPSPAVSLCIPLPSHPVRTCSLSLFSSSCFLSSRSLRLSLYPTAQSPRTNLFPQSLQLLLLPFFPFPLSLSVSHCPVTPYEPVPSISSAPPASFLPVPSVSLCIPLPSHPVRTCSLNLFSSSCFLSSRSLCLSLYPTAQSPRTNLFPQSLQLLLLPFFPLPLSLSVSHCPVTPYEPVPSISSAPPASFLPVPSVSLCIPLPSHPVRTCSLNLFSSSCFLSSRSLCLSLYPTAQSPRTNLFPQSLQLLLLPFFPLPLSLSVSHCPVTPYEPVPSISSAPPASFLPAPSVSLCPTAQSPRTNLFPQSLQLLLLPFFPFPLSLSVSHCPVTPYEPVPSISSAPPASFLPAPSVSLCIPLPSHPVRTCSLSLFSSSCFLSSRSLCLSLYPTAQSPRTNLFPQSLQLLLLPFFPLPLSLSVSHCPVTPYEPVPSISSAPPASFLPAPSVSLCIPLPSHPVRTCSLSLFSSSCFLSSRSLRLSLYPTAQSPRTNLFPQSLQLLLLPFFPLPLSLHLLLLPLSTLLLSGKQLSVKHNTKNIPGVTPLHYFVTQSAKSIQSANYFVSISTTIVLKSVCLSLFANCRSQFLFDRLGRCLKLFVSPVIPSSHEFASQFGLAIFFTSKNTQTLSQKLSLLNEPAKPKQR